MKLEASEAIVEGLEHVMKALGEHDYDSGAEKVCQFARGFAQFAELVKSKEHLRCLLKMTPDFEQGEEGIAIFAASKIPQLMAMTIPELIQQFASQYVPRSGRPRALKNTQARALLKGINTLEMIDGYSRSVAMRSAAREFHVSLRSAQRAYRQRKQILAGERDYTVQEALQWLGEKLRNQRSRQLSELVGKT